MQQLATALSSHLREDKTLAKLPKLFFFDDQTHVIIMEDVAPPGFVLETERVPTSVSLDDLCRSSYLGTIKESNGI